MPYPYRRTWLWIRVVLLSAFTVSYVWVLAPGGWTWAAHAVVVSAVGWLGVLAVPVSDRAGRAPFITLRLPQQLALVAAVLLSSALVGIVSDVASPVAGGPWPGAVGILLLYTALLVGDVIGGESAAQQSTRRR